MAIPNEEFITVKQAKEELGDQAYFAFHKWLTEKGYRNLDEKYVTKSQLNEFVKEIAGTFRGVSDTNNLWGQTREYWRGYKPVKKRRR